MDTERGGGGRHVVNKERGEPATRGEKERREENRV